MSLEDELLMCDFACRSKSLHSIRGIKYSLEQKQISLNLMPSNQWQDSGLFFRLTTEKISVRERILRTKHINTVSCLAEDIAESSVLRLVRFNFIAEFSCVSGTMTTKTLFMVNRKS